MKHKRRKNYFYLLSLLFFTIAVAASCGGGGDGGGGGAPSGGGPPAPALQNVVYEIEVGGTQHDIYLVKEDGTGGLPLPIPLMMNGIVAAPLITGLCLQEIQQQEGISISLMLTAQAARLHLQIQRIRNQSAL